MTRHRFLVRSIVWGVLLWAPIAAVLSCALSVLLPSALLVGRDNTSLHAVRTPAGDGYATLAVVHRSWCFTEVQRSFGGMNRPLAAFADHPDIEPWMIRGDRLATTTPANPQAGPWLVFGYGWPEPMMYATVDFSSKLHGGKQLTSGRVVDRRILPGQFNWRGIAVSVPIHMLLWTTPIVLIEAWRYRRRLARRQCPRCRYPLVPNTIDRHGAPQVPGCPECGLGYEPRALRGA